MVSKYPKQSGGCVSFPLISDSSTTVSGALANVSIALGAGNTEMDHAERETPSGKKTEQWAKGHFVQTKSLGVLSSEKQEKSPGNARLLLLQEGGGFQDKIEEWTLRASETPFRGMSLERAGRVTATADSRCQQLKIPAKVVD